jgi:hypothetical protein
MEAVRKHMVGGKQKKQNIPFLPSNASQPPNKVY